MKPITREHYLDAVQRAAKIAYERGEHPEATLTKYGDEWFLYCPKGFLMLDNSKNSFSIWKGWPEHSRASDVLTRLLPEYLEKLQKALKVIELSGMEHGTVVENLRETPIGHPPKS